MTTHPLPALAELRTQAGLSQRALATACGVSFNVIRRLEAGGDAGHITLKTLQSMARAVNATIAELTVPTSAASHPVAGQPEITYNEARLLRRIQRGETVTKALSRTERQLILPALRNRGLIHIHNGQPQLADAVAATLRR